MQMFARLTELLRRKPRRRHASPDRDGTRPRCGPARRACDEYARSFSLEFMSWL